MLTLVIFVFASVASTADAESPPRIQVVEANDHTFTMPNAKLCKGRVPEFVEISKIGISSVDLEKGVECLAEDFDGNGSLDFLLYGVQPSSEPLRPALLIFFERASVLRTQLFPYSLEFFKLSDPERKRYPGKKSKMGLIHRPSGDHGIVYFFNPKTGRFSKDAYIYENGRKLGD